MEIEDVIWKDQFIEKLADKHRVTTGEVEEILYGDSLFRRANRGNVAGEDVYAAYGQTEAGRYLIVFFVRKVNRAALPISARNMSQSERKFYNAKKSN